MRKRCRTTTSMQEETENLSEDHKLATREETAHKPSNLHLSRTSHVRDFITPLSIADSPSKYLKTISWNVNGFRAMMERRSHILEELILKHDPDILCLQETKLQWEHVSQFQDILPGYRSLWSCSTIKKGYSGTAVFLKASTITTASHDVIHNNNPQSSENEPSQKRKKLKQISLPQFLTLTTANQTIHQEEKDYKTNSSSDSPAKVTLLNVSRDFEDFEASHAHVGEGRVITLEFNAFVLVTCYVPNAGENLKRLDYRINQWDPFLRNYLNFLHRQKNQMKKNKKPVIITGDLNVGHLDLDIHNPFAKHIPKQSCLTPQERGSFSDLLQETGFMDALRFFYPKSRGQFTYWSQRLSHRAVNRGLRLDYFLCSSDLFPNKKYEVISQERVVEKGEDKVILSDERREEVVEETIPIPGVYDSYLLHQDTIGHSDHCPIVLVLRIL